jgi:hypothetical protein
MKNRRQIGSIEMLEDRSLMSGYVVNLNIPRYPSTSPQLNFTSNSFHQINAQVPTIAANPTDAALAGYVTHIPLGESQLLPILEKDVAAFQKGTTTPTTTQATTAVTNLYEILLGREPDPVGIYYDVQALETGTTLQQMVNVIVTSNEYIQDNTGTANANQTQFVTSLYENVLGRAPDAGGLAFWVNEINTNAMSVQQVATAFVYSPEAMTSATSILQTQALPVTIPTYYGGSGTVTGNFAGTSKATQMENLIQNDTVAFLDNNVGKEFNVLKSGVGWASDNLLIYNGYVN